VNLEYPVWSPHDGLSHDTDPSSKNVSRHLCIHATTQL